MVQDQTNIKML